MIAKSSPKRRSGRGSFVDLDKYLRFKVDGEPRPDLIANWNSGLNPETIALEMEAIAAKRAGLSDPVYHVILSTRPGETIGVEQAKIAVDAMRHSLGAEPHQYFAAMHFDEDTGRYHIHLAINKVSLRGRMLNHWQDYAKQNRAVEWCEREFGLQVDRRPEWRTKLGEKELSLGFDPPEVGSKRAPGLDRQDRRATVDRRDAVRRTHYSWVELLKQEAVPATLLAAHGGAAWGDLHAVLRGYGVRLEAAGSGARVIGPEPGQRVKASDLGLEIRKLEATLGAFKGAPFTDPDWRRRLETAQTALWASRSWADLHATFESVGLAIEKTGTGGRVLDLGTPDAAGGRHIMLRQLGGPSVKTLEKRLGEYEMAPAVLQRAEHELARCQAGLRDRVDLLCREPEIVLHGLGETRSVWSLADVEREVRSHLGVRSGHDDLVWEAVAGATGASVALDKDAFTTPRIIAEEMAVFKAADALYGSIRDVYLRASSPELDVQQQAAYAHVTGRRDLAIVTGIAGAGKSRLLRDVCAAYTEAGYRVIGAAVAGDAARTLGVEAEIGTRTVAKLVSDLQNGRDRLDAKTVVVIDEAGTLGAEQAKALLEKVRDAGARQLLFGDVPQHEGVGRGPVLRGLVDVHDSLDMSDTRRAREVWLRDVARDLRAGVVSRALDVLRQKGAVREFAMHEEARDALVRAWLDKVTAGHSALLVGTRVDDVVAMNELARGALELGEERVYTTDFGERGFAIGELLVGREGAHGGVNGDRYTLAAHRDDGRLELVRERDGAKVTWDLHEHRAIDYGYATTSYRSQGRTVDFVFALASSAEARRGLYVDVTRARENVTLAYGKDQVQDFGELLVRAQRELRKMLVRDVMVDVGLRRDVASPPELEQKKKSRGMRR